MGCPDWPKCFDMLVPPTCACQLPPDAEMRLNAKREQKLEKFAQLLEKLGMGDKAIEIRKDTRLREHEPFSPVKAWIEYINRLYGAITGIFTLLMGISAFQFFRRKPLVFWLSIAGTFLIFFNAWLGSKVVVTNLLPGLVSMHFMISFAAVVLIMAALRFQRDVNPKLLPGENSTFWAGLAVLSLLQISLGALVRERVDMLENVGQLTQENGWLNMAAMGNLFLVHRGLSMIVLAVHAWIWWKAFRNKESNRVYMNLMHLIMVLFLVQISTGALNTMYPFPVVARTLHILAGSICFGIQVHFVLQLLRIRKTENATTA
jgi:cytochrome c oxidase assembly protein subunit 15